MAFGTIELGGTKTMVGLGTDPDDLNDAIQIETSTPNATLAAAAAHLLPLEIAAVGIASFGPLELRPGHDNYGHITNTPKPGWSSVDVLGAVAERLGLPVAIDTDVNGSALGEWKWGALAGVSSAVYITVGTGIGGSLIVDGEVQGTLSHPEMGHVVVNVHPTDSYRGRCPYHVKCLEGMASGPAIEERFGKPASELDSVGQEEAVALLGFYLAQGLRNIAYTVGPDRFVIGGGVSKLPGFHGAVRMQLKNQLAGYPGIPEQEAEDYVVAPRLGDRSGLAGGLILAERALS